MPTKSVAIRIPVELYEYLTERAEREHRTLSNMIISLMEDAKAETGTVNVVSVTRDSGTHCYAFRESKDAIQCFCYWKDKGAVVMSEEIDIQ